MTKKLSGVVILLVCVLLTLWPLSSDRWFFTHDFVHGARIAEYARGLTDGQLPVIWSKNFGYGYGMPLFLFYAPLPYLIGSVFYLIGADLVTIMKGLYLLSSVLGGVGVFLLTKKMFGHNSGIVAGAIYTLAPYRALNLYVRGAVSESFGLALAPFVLWGVILAWQKKWYGGLVLAGSLFLVTISHNLSLLLILPVALALVLYLWLETILIRRADSVRSSLTRVIRTGWGLVLGLGLGLFYLIPAAVYQNLTKVSQIVLAGYSDYRHHFLYIRQFFDSSWGYGGSNWGPADDMSYFLGYAPLFGLGFVTGHFLTRVAQFFWRKNFKFDIKTTRIWFFTMVAGVCLLFATPKLLVIWQSVSILRVLQFPWRFLGPASLMLAITTGGLIGLVNSRYQKFLVVLLIGLGFLAIGYFRPNGYLDQNLDLYYDEPARIATDMSGILPDYIPRAIPEKITPAEGPVWQLPLTSQLLTVKTWDSHSLSVEIASSQPASITLAVANFPGWQALINSQPAEITSSDVGLISLAVPAGHNQIELKYGLTKVQQWGLLASGLSLLILVFLSYYWYGHRYDDK